jgi:hypothetical protein
VPLNTSAPFITSGFLETTSSFLTTRNLLYRSLG